MSRPARKKLLEGFSPSAKIGVVLVAVFLATALLGPLLAPHSPTAHNLDRILEGPSVDHWLGTDQNGVDVLSAMLYGARAALIISGCVVLLSSIIGVAMGLIAGYYGGKVDEIIMRVVDILLAFPGILLNIAIVALVAAPGIPVLIFALTVNAWVGYARLARGQVLSLRETEYVMAARAIGAPPHVIMFRHILPNMLAPLFVLASFAFGGIVAVEAALSFLGLGPQLNYTWGALLDQGTTFVWKTPRLVLIPGFAIMLVVLGANLFGDGLRDKLDPKRYSDRT
jgi:peptide/nickel transport system permease protein